MFHNIKRNHILHLLTITAVIFFIIYLIVGSDFIFGAPIDWINQHSVIPDYFRQQFYQTGKLIPDFAMHLGAGQNIFNFAYYGFLSPITLISYAFPRVSMVNYVMISSVVLLLASVYLFYMWMIKNKFSDSIAFVATFLFACASPLLFHSHKQVMFVNYMPFMIMALMGIDRLFDKKKKGLLIISVFLMLMSSYFFSVSGLFALTIYAIYKYLGCVQKVTFKSFIRNAIPYAVSIITALFMACILLIPTFSTIMAGRGEKSFEGKNLLSMFLPRFPFTTLMYSSYGMGLTSICILALIAFIIYGKKKDRIFLSVSILAFASFPFLLYALNGFLYARDKAMISFMPIVVLIVAYFIEGIIHKKYALKPLFIAYPIIVLLVILSFRYTPLYILAITIDLAVVLSLCVIYKKPVLFYTPLIMISIVLCYFVNISEPLLEKDYIKDIYSQDKYDIINNTIGEDDTLFRSNDISETKSTNNIIYHNNFLQTGFYSSTFNRNYVHFCNYDLNLANPTVNDISITNTKDILFQTLMGVKYIVSNTSAPVGYSLVTEQGDYKIYYNDNVYSIGFASHELMSLDEFKSLSAEDRKAALLKYIVVDKELPNVYTSPFTPVEIDYDLGFGEMEDGYYKVNLSQVKKLSIPLESAAADDIYIVKLSIKQREQLRATVIVNGIQNSLSGFDAAYPNSNYNFQFVVSDTLGLDSLDFRFNAGNYLISGLEFTKVNYDTIKDLGSNLDMLTNAVLEANNIITGTIDVASDGYFTTTIPYDKGFTVYVDGLERNYEKVNNTFIGFEIESGSHDIRIEYHAPYLKEGKILTLIGIIMFIGILSLQFYIDRKSLKDRN